MPGVFVQAHMVSQILSAVLDQRPLLWSWPFWVDAIWIGGWTLVGGTLIGLMRVYRQPSGQQWPLALLIIGGASGLLYGVCWLLLLQGGWVPFVPTIAGLVTASGLTFYVQSNLKL
jgi:CHASE2 domain-containing sensor protein